MLFWSRCLTYPKDFLPRYQRGDDVITLIAVRAEGNCASARFVQICQNLTFVTFYVIQQTVAPSWPFTVCCSMFVTFHGTVQYCSTFVTLYVMQLYCSIPSWHFMVHCSTAVPSWYSTLCSCTAVYLRDISWYGAVLQYLRDTSRYAAALQYTFVTFHGTVQYFSKCMDLVRALLTRRLLRVSVPIYLFISHYSTIQSHIF